ncbi:MAG: hypothetical protein P8O16_06035 [Algoriphagus sp.]|jgi:hypothetical protein|uniref:hypothetical protein n=1 Tax=Algoriphagus sp. TaxID=1872435 RepID=UPI0026126E33|nr:hypothetical protein [Algoriphagus sp.]MDG1276822.1 hypothetical protein [Algoriphagus sp.]
MKKTLIIATMLFAGAAMANPIELTSQISPVGIEAQQEQEKVKIDPETLPDAVKASIAGDETIASLPIAEAWKISLPEDKAHFAVTFDNGTEEKLTKKYDEAGNEIVA